MEKRNISNKPKSMYISLDKKIKIFEKFFKTGEELTGKTVFENYPIGHWSVQLRSLIKNGKKITPEQKEKLEELGLLEKQIDSTIDEKIDALINWSKKYPRARFVKGQVESLKDYAKTEEEHKKLLSEYQKMLRYYEYIRTRKSIGELKPKQIRKCKDGNVGGVFGIPANTANKYKLDELKTKYIIRNYGTIPNFIGEYIAGKISEDDVKYLGGSLREAIDVDLNIKSRGYDKLVKDIRMAKIPGKKKIQENLLIYSRKRVDEMLQCLKDRERIVIQELYGLKTGEGKELPEVADKAGICKEHINFLKQKALNRLLAYKGKSIKYGDHIINLDDTGLDKRIKQDFINTIKNSGIVFNTTEEQSQDDMYKENLEIKLKAEIIKNIISFSKKITSIEEQSKICNELKKEEQIWEKIKEFITEDNGLSISEKENTELSKIDKRLPKQSLKDFLSFQLSTSGKTLKETENLSKNVVEILQDTEFSGILPEKVVMTKGDILIEFMDLSIRSFNGLKRAKINSLSELLKVEELHKFENFGDKSIEEIKEKAKQYVVDAQAYKIDIDLNDDTILDRIESKIQFTKKQEDEAEQFKNKLKKLPDDVFKAYMDGNTEKLVRDYCNVGLKLEQPEKNNVQEEAVEEKQENSSTEEQKPKDKTQEKKKAILRFLANTKKLSDIDRKLEIAYRNNHKKAIQKLTEQRNKTSKEIQDYLGK